ncbi:MAG: PorT family protein [Bacteroidetes bacterium]|nr:PorT family protein [Bacteroidota bacterium]
MKNFILIVLTAFLTTSVISQEIDLGLKAGANFASITDASGLSNRTGFLIGVFAGVKFSDKLGIQGDLLYSQQGANSDPKDIDLNYINVPIVLKYYLIQGFNLQAGPQFGFIVDDNIEAESFDLAGVLGLGYDFPFGIRIEGRHNFGLTDVFNSDKGKNSVTSIAIGYSFL